MNAGRRPPSRSAAVLALVIAFTACAGSGESAPEPTVAPTTTSPPVPRESDGTLRIGALIPLSNPRLGPALEGTVRDAAAAINDAGGVLGNDVVVTVQDEGASAATAAAAITALLAANVDAIVGPSSSLTALGALDDIITAELIACSPTATAIALDEFPDERLFFRTIAGDSFQAIALTETAENTGQREVAIVHVDDAYGRPYAAAVQEAIDERPLDLVTTVAIAAGDDVLDDDAAALVRSGARVAIVIGAASDAARFLDALGRQEFGGITDVIVNDPIRDATVRPVVAGLPTSLRTRITGVAPQIAARSADGTDSTPFAPQVTDCMNLLALAAVQADSDMPTLIAGQMASVSSGGSVCTTFAECVEELELNRQIDYNGTTGIELNREGETTRAVFETFEFERDGTDVFDRSITVRR